MHLSCQCYLQTLVCRVGLRQVQTLETVSRTVLVLSRASGTCVVVPGTEKACTEVSVSGCPVEAAPFNDDEGGVPVTAEGEDAVTWPGTEVDSMAILVPTVRASVKESVRPIAWVIIWMVGPTEESVKEPGGLVGPEGVNSVTGPD